jgi:hypothetical protein
MSACHGGCAPELTWGRVFLVAFLALGALARAGAVVPLVLDVVFLAAWCLVGVWLVVSWPVRAAYRSLRERAEAARFARRLAAQRARVFAPGHPASRR